MRTPLGLDFRSKRTSNGDTAEVQLVATSVTRNLSSWNKACELVSIPTISASLVKDMSMSLRTSPFPAFQTLQILLREQTPIRIVPSGENSKSLSLCDGNHAAFFVDSVRSNFPVTIPEQNLTFFLGLSGTNGYSVRRR